MKREDIEAAAKRDYEALVGREVLATSVLAVVEETPGRVLVPLDPPARLRIVPYLSPRQVLVDVETRWVDDVLRPIYGVEIVSGHPILEDLDQIWAMGNSYDAQGVVVSGGSILSIEGIEDLPEPGLHFVDTPAATSDAAPDPAAPPAPVVNPSSPWFRPS